MTGLRQPPEESFREASEATIFRGRGNKKRIRSKPETEENTFSVLQGLYSSICGGEGKVVPGRRGNEFVQLFRVEGELRRGEVKLMGRRGDRLQLVLTCDLEKGTGEVILADPARRPEKEGEGQNKERIRVSVATP